MTELNTFAFKLVPSMRSYGIPQWNYLIRLINQLTDHLKQTVFAELLIIDR